MEPREVEGLLLGHLARRGLACEDRCWAVRASELGGRGLAARRPIARGQLVYADRALLLGPRGRDGQPPMCAVCARERCPLVGCDGGCGLPVCSAACAESTDHQAECVFLRRLRPLCAPGWCPELLRALAAVRALFLCPADRQLLGALQAHEAARHSREVDLLARSLAGGLDVEDERLMRRACRAMDTNAFEAAAAAASDAGPGVVASTGLRALFPLGALTNHRCVPNTRHLLNGRGDLQVYAVAEIAEGQEISMSYADLLWDTTLRRQFLRATKHFCCDCPRCSDPTEHGSLLAALRCADGACAGLLLPDRPLSFDSPWTCGRCRLVISSKQIAAIRAGIASAIAEMSGQSPRKALKFLQRQLAVLVPETNYVMMGMMFQILSLFGRVDGLTWKDLTDNELDTKIDYCHKLIACLDSLNCGDCTKKGLVLYELYVANAEKLKRLGSCPESPTSGRQSQLSSTLNEHNLTEALIILKDDIVAPSDYRQIYASVNQSLKTTSISKA
ncbi:SET domain-containing protein SmydA-8-like [Phymastichus coffea]|uniref:SET domain-containing protein SmydA-8-like n=1 Tax=Phymastichus coffea TaxID=108790 RepID=UPI00273B723E|nr:SET domain-containing protein SmydA-8-like [Phymastichus coffea]